MRGLAVPLLSAAIAAVAGALLAPRGQAQDPPHGEIRIDCGECHNPERWTPVEPGRFRHDAVGFALEGSHAIASCRSCHPSLRFAQVGTACGDCHRDAHRGELGTRCETCHTPTTWTNQREMFRAHNRSRFPLMSVHARLDCAACHKGQKPYEYANTPAECGSCHYETYLATTSPNHVASGFPRRCEDCHGVTATSWHEAVFSHPASFPLAGGHAGLACARCHTSGKPGPIASACYSCHQADYQATSNPGHAAGRFPTNCESCHSIAGWRPASFDHGQTRFPLTGAHARTDCARCHANGRYTGTPTDCYSCHRANYDSTANPRHAASGFPTQCQDCHTTDAWRPASFDHDGRYFPIYSGKHRGRWTSCGDCHVNPSNYRAFECITCHEHSNRASVDKDHKEVNGYVYASSACYQCHRDGRADALGRVKRLPGDTP